MKFTVETATDSPEVNRLSQFVFDEARPTEDERLHMEVALSANGSLGDIVLRAAHFAVKHGVTVPVDLMRGAAEAAAELGEPVPDYALEDLEACL